jgi:hypothetical protein
MNDTLKQEALSKVPEVTLVFWIIKIAATTLGETGGDSVTMTLGWGYLEGTALFVSLLIVLVIAQIRRKHFPPFSTGRRSSLPLPSAPPWPISQTGRSGSATPAARRCCSFAPRPCSDSGTSRRVPSR